MHFTCLSGGILIHFLVITSSIRQTSLKRRNKAKMGEKERREDSERGTPWKSPGRLKWGGIGTFKGGVGGQEMEKAGAHHEFFFAPSWLEILFPVLFYFQCCLRLLCTAVTAPLACSTPAVVKHNSTPCLYLSSVICII